MLNIAVISGSSNPPLTEAICKKLGIPAGACKLSKFSNQETNVEIYESVREKDVYIIQSSCGRVNDNLMELLIMLAACRTASAARVTAVIPCFPYARQSDAPFRESRAPFKRVHSQSGLEMCESDGYRQWSARPGTLIADMLTAAGADHIITMDLHDPQFQGYFDIPVDVVYAEPSILNYIRRNVPDYKHAVIVSPDAGGAKRATSVANALNLDFALIHRESRNRPTSAIALVGHVTGRTCIIIDDIADTCHTIGLAVDMLKKHGAGKVYAVVTHGMLSPPSYQVLKTCELEKLAITNTIPLEEEMAQLGKVEVIDVSGTFSEAIRRCHNGESLSAYMFES